MKTTKQLVKFDFDIAVITALDAKYKDIQITDGKSYAVVMQGLAEYRELRLAIDDKHKELKRDILEAGRSLDGDKNRLKTLLEPGENHLKEIRQIEDDRKAKIKEEKDRKERERIEAIQEKIKDIVAMGTVLHNISSSTIEERLIIVKGHKVTDLYMEFTGQAIQAKKEAIIALEFALTERLHFEKEEVERKAEAERLEAQRKEQKAAQAKIDEENRHIEEEKAQIEATKNAEKERKGREEFERQAKDKAEAYAKDKAEQERRDALEKEEAEKEEKARQEAMAPDKERVLIWIQNFNETVIPKPYGLKSKEAQEIVRIALEQIEMILQDAKDKTEKL